MTNDKDREDELTIAYLLGVRHGREDERAKIAAEASQPTQSDALREIPAAALDALRNGQKQIDRDGVMVGVSRQALDEVLAALQEQSKCP